jgi:putative oxidoreductase
MAMDTSGSSHPAFARVDAIANAGRDLWLLIGRILLVFVFLFVGWGTAKNIPGFVAYLTNLKVPYPGFWVYVAFTTELVAAIAIILGVATRYAALLGILFLIIATALAHRYWEYPAAQLANQYNHFLKNIGLMGGMLIIFAVGPGRFSLDQMLSRS